MSDEKKPDGRRNNGKNPNILKNLEKGRHAPKPRGLTDNKRLSNRGLAFACHEAVSDEELAEWLLTIAIEGRWPKRSRPYTQSETRHITPSPDPVGVAMPPGEGVRKYALEEFIRRRNGMPIQGIQLQAQI